MAHMIEFIHKLNTRFNYLESFPTCTHTHTHSSVKKFWSHFFSLVHLQRHSRASIWYTMFLNLAFEFISYHPHSTQHKQNRKVFTFIAKNNVAAKKPSTIHWLQSDGINLWAISVVEWSCRERTVNMCFSGLLNFCCAL